jgi:epoxyqueuosine reductase
MIMENETKQADLRNWVESLIFDSLEKSGKNYLYSGLEEKIWDKPLIGFSGGDDPLYPFFKEDIGDFYWLPIEAFKKEFADQSIESDQLTIISWVLPHTEVTRKDHRKESQYSSERWSRSRLFGEELNNELRREVAAGLNRAGYSAVAPMLHPKYQREDSTKYGYASSWSERHAAFVAGLGTFGLSDGLITPLGKSIRVGSVIAKIHIKPDTRPYTSYNEYCLYYTEKSCRKCIERCPTDAISKSGHDKVACRTYIKDITTAYNLKEYNLEIHSCGLCQVKTPCEFRIPARKKKSNELGVE